MLKKILLIPFLILKFNFSFSQAIRPFKLFDIGTGVNLNKVAGDAETYTNTTSFNFNLTYNANPYLNLVTDLQFGKLAGGDSVATLTGRQFQNSFKSIAFRSQFQLGLLLKGKDDILINSLRNFYVGAGVGAIDNNIDKINRTSKKLPGFTTNGINRSLEVYFPLRVGYDYKVKNAFKETLFKLDFGYQYNLGIGDNIDGFETGRLKDNFSQFFLGVKICAFGNYWAHSY